MKKLFHISLIGSFVLLTSMLMLSCDSAGTEPGEPNRETEPGTDGDNGGTGGNTGNGGTGGNTGNGGTGGNTGNGGTGGNTGNGGTGGNAGNGGTGGNTGNGGTGGNTGNGGTGGNTGNGGTGGNTGNGGTGGNTGPKIDHDNYILIANKDELKSIGLNPDYPLNMNYRLTADIDLSAELWEPIGSTTEPFLGSFDGNGKTIRGLRINKPANHYVGLFAQIGDATTAPEIKNLAIMVHANGIVGNSQLGALAGPSFATINNVQVSGGAIKGKYDYVGGLVGWQKGGTIKNSSATEAVNGEGHSIGGLVGAQSNSSITNSYATGAVMGAVVGTSWRWRPGGLVGWQDNSSITNSYYDGTTTGQMQGRNNTADAPGEVSAYYTVNNQVMTLESGGTPITQADFAGWDFIGIDGNDPIWEWVGDGQWPQLSWQTP